jgi:hypothetical protein
MTAIRLLFRESVSHHTHPSRIVSTGLPTFPTPEAAAMDGFPGEHCRVGGEWVAA